MVSGIVGDGAVVSAQVRGGMTRGSEFLFEIHGSEGDLALAATMRASTQRQELTVRGARGTAKDLADMPVPAKYRWVPEAMPEGSPYKLRNCTSDSVKPSGRGRPFILASIQPSRVTGCST